MNLEEIEKIYVYQGVKQDGEEKISAILVAASSEDAAIARILIDDPEGKVLAISDVTDEVIGHAVRSIFAYSITENIKPPSIVIRPSSERPIPPELQITDTKTIEVSVIPR